MVCGNHNGLSKKERSESMPIATSSNCRSVTLSLGLLLLLSSFSVCDEARCESYRSPFDVAFSSDGRWLVVSDRTASCLYIVDPSSSSEPRVVSLQGRPTGVAWIGRRRLLVAEYDAGTLAEVDVSSGRVLRRLSVGPKPYGVAITPDATTAVVTDFGLGLVQFMDLVEGTVAGEASVGPQPGFLAVTASGKTAIVGNQIIRGVSSNLAASACISLIDLQNGSVLAEVFLPDGSSNVRCVVTDRAGRWAYVAHTRGRVALPTTQLERGWVNVNALSIIDLQKRSVYATLLLDRVTAGAADPWGVALTPDGTTAFVTLSGVHEVARLDLVAIAQVPGWAA